MVEMDIYHIMDCCKDSNNVIEKCIAIKTVKYNLISSIEQAYTHFIQNLFKKLLLSDGNNLEIVITNTFCHGYDSAGNDNLQHLGI